jgi:hypothetical protein
VGNSFDRNAVIFDDLIARPPRDRLRSLNPVFDAEWMAIFVFQRFQQELDAHLFFYPIDDLRGIQFDVYSGASMRLLIEPNAGLSWDVLEFKRNEPPRIDFRLRV